VDSGDSPHHRCRNRLLVEGAESVSGLPPTRNPTLMRWEGDLIPPVTSYASSTSQTLGQDRLSVPPSTNKTNSAVVQRRPRRNGLMYFYSHGGLSMPIPGMPTPGNGGVMSSAFQRVLVQLHDWVINRAWYAAGYPRNLGYTFRVNQIATKTTGGAVGAMQPRPRFAKVQVIPRATAQPQTYNTKSAKP
jgi:hypothetical protein